MISPTDYHTSELSLAIRASRTLLVHSLQHNHGTPCMHLLAFHIFSNSSPRLLSVDTLYTLAECENGQIPGMCTLGAVFRDGIPGVLPPSLSRAASLWRKAVSAYGCALSSYLLACAAEAGAGVERRPALAAVLYETALLAEGFGFAAAALARLLEDGAEGVERNVGRAVRLYEFAVRKGSTDAMARLARILKDGRVAGVPKGLGHEVELLEQAARDGNSGQAMNALAHMLERGAQGVGSDPVRAMALYERAVEQEEDVDAMLALARMLIHGQVERDVERAIETLERAMDCGSTDAVWQLACLLLEEDDARDEIRAFHLFNELVDEEQYSAFAKMEIADMLTGNSSVVPMDAVKAAELYEEVLTEKEEVNAVVALASMLLHGCGELAADPVKAVALYERAIELHDSIPAMNALGGVLCGWMGRDTVPRDVRRGIRCFERAMHLGNTEAKYNLARMLTLSTNDTDIQPIDLERGKVLYEKLIEDHDHLWAMINLARCLVSCDDEEGEGEVDGIDQQERQQVAKAGALLERAIRIGLQNSEGELRPLGIVPEDDFCLKHDNVSERNRERAVMKGAHIVAMCYLAQLLVLNCVPKNVYKSVTLLERALADFEAPDAFDNLTFNFQAVSVVIQEANGDIELCRRAARICKLFIEKTGKTEAMCLLAGMLVHGTGVRRSPEEAVRIYDRAICGGDKKAMVALGELLRTGAPGVTADRRKAFTLFTRVLAEDTKGALARTAVVDLALLCSKPCAKRAGLKS